MTTDLVYLRARWYNTLNGTFTSYRWRTDESFDTVPYSHHPYAYALGNPTLYVDPAGTYAIANSNGKSGSNSSDPWEICGPPPERDIIFGPAYYCNRSTHQWEPVLGGEFVIPGASSAVKQLLVAGAALCVGIISWLSTQGGNSQPVGIAGNTAPNPPATTPTPNDQEQVLRKVLGLEYDLIGTSDDHVRTYLGLSQKSKIADILGTNKVTGRWLVAESKGNRMDTAVNQLRVTVDGLLNKHPSAGGQIDLRIYTNELQWNRIINDPRGLGGYKLDPNGFLGYFDDTLGTWVYEEIHGMRILVQQTLK